MTRLHADAYYDDYWARPKRPTANDPHAHVRMKLLLESLDGGVAGRRVLDAGSGVGELVGALSARGADVTGMDVSPRIVEEAASAYPASRFVAHNAEELPWPFESGSFDVVVAFEVIEHLLRPRRLLEGAHAALADGGRIVLTTPYHGLIKNLVVASVAFDRHFAIEGDHIRFFSDRALRRLLDESDFVIESLCHYGRVPGLAAGTFVCARKR